MRRTAHASVIVDQYLVIIGGFSKQNEQRCEDLVVFDMQKGTCTQVELSGREPRSLSAHSACYWKDRQIIVYGGIGSGMMYSEVGIITLSNTEPITAQWRTVETDTKIERHGHTAHIYKDNQMIVFGGVGRDFQPFEGIHILNLDDFKWMYRDFSEKPLEESLVFNRSVLYGNKIYTFGCGFQNKFKFISLDLESYDWKEFPLDIDDDNPPVFGTIQEYNGKIYLAQNVLSGSRLILKSFDINQEKWSSDLQYKDQNHNNPTDFSLNVYDNQLVLYGGQYDGVASNLLVASNSMWLFKLEESKSAPQKQPKDDVAAENIMKRFLREAPYSDVTFEVESEQIPAHKWWLCKKSKYFANMFSSGMIEAKSSKIAVTDMSAATFRAFLEYLYSDDIELDVSKAQDLLTQADKYSVPALKQLCEQFLIGNISADNYVLLANLSELLEANKLRDAVRDYIAKSIKTLKTRKDFEEISMEMLRDVIIKVTVR